MMKFTDILRTILHRHTFLIEIQNSTLAIIVGLVFLLNNGHLYNRYPDTYKWMEFAPDYAWGCLYLSIGTLHLICLVFRKRWARKQILLAKFGLWIFIALCVTYGDPFAVSGYFYIVFALLALHGFLRIEILKIDGLNGNDD